MTRIESFQPDRTVKFLLALLIVTLWAFLLRPFAALTPAHAGVGAVLDVAETSSSVANGDLIALEKSEPGTSAVFIRYKNRSDHNMVAILTKSGGRWALENKLQLD